MILMLIFSKHVIHIVLGKFVPKTFLSINWDLAFVYIINIIYWPGVEIREICIAG